MPDPATFDRGPQIGIARLILDVGVALGLVVALAAVFAVDSFTESPPIADLGPQLPDPPPPESKPLRLAVTLPPKQFDDMGHVLKQLGEGYDFKTIGLEELSNPDVVKNFDVIFVTCGSAPSSWLGVKVGAGGRDATIYDFREDMAKLLRDNLRAFVENGGTLYASDWQYPLIARCFSEFADDTAGPGDVQDLDAEVVDEELKERIGKTIHLRFNLPDWKPAGFRGREVEKILQGHYRGMDGSRASAPLLVKFPLGKGHVIFTSFHNEENVSKQQTELLNYLVFSSVTARAEAESLRDLVSGGFSVQTGSLVTPTKDRRSFTKTYACQQPGALHFVLAFETNPKALIELQVVDPSGRIYKKEGNSTINIDIPNAATGTWKYTATAKQMPFENFPYKLSVLQK